MSLTFTAWPFLPSDRRSHEETERWWPECYLPGRADVVLRGQEH